MKLVVYLKSLQCITGERAIWSYPLPGFKQQTSYKMGPPKPTISGFIPGYTHLQPWLNRVKPGVITTS